MAHHTCHRSTPPATIVPVAPFVPLLCSRPVVLLIFFSTVPIPGLERYPPGPDGLCLSSRRHGCCRGLDCQVKSSSGATRPRGDHPDPEELLDMTCHRSFFKVDPRLMLGQPTFTLGSTLPKSWKKTDGTSYWRIIRCQQHANKTVFRKLILFLFF